MVNDNSHNLIRQKQKVARNQLSLNRERERLRKADTRRKIQLGGLIIKAGLGDESSNLILGILCDAKNKLISRRQEWCEIGNIEFNK